MSYKIVFVNKVPTLIDLNYTEESKLETYLQNFLNSLTDYKSPRVLKTTDSITLEWFCDACLIELYINESETYKWSVVSFIHGTTFNGILPHTEFDKLLEKEMYRYFRK